MFDDEPVRSGWAEIRELGERLETKIWLVPPNERVRIFGTAHEIMGENGLLWNARITALEAGFTTDGTKGFPLPVAQYLAPKYGYAKDRVDHARRRMKDVIALLSSMLGDRPYYLGDSLTALDIYSAAAMSLFDPMPDDRCPMMPMIRHSFESMRGEVDIPAALFAHHDRVYERHLELPITL